MLQAARLSQHSRQILAGRYTVGAEAPEDIFIRVASYYGSKDNFGHAERLLGYMEKMWFVPASPILSNGGTDRGLPISCYLATVDDSRQGLSDHYDELMWISTMGGGSGANWSDIRSAGTMTSRGIKTTGAIQFLHVADSFTLASNQGSIRQGAYAAYMDISHPEIFEFLSMRKPSGGDSHRKNLNIHHGINIPDAFMEAVLCDDEWALIDPHSQEVKETVQARHLWQTILEIKLLTGEPYLHFIDASNRALHPDLRAQGLRIRGSNLCSEITLVSAPDRTAICCLSSLNIEKYDEWKDVPGFIEDVIEFLDNVLDDFINKAPKQLWRAVHSAQQERSIGLGQMGFHSYLQKNMIPIESPAAIGTNLQIARYIDECTRRANAELACRRGPALGLKTDRFANLTAIAPNATTAIIANTSPSIEPWNANIFVQKTAAGAMTMRNHYLDLVLRTKSNDEAIIEGWWFSILENGGSCQHLECLDSWEKDVFKTAVEINQLQLIKLAADRQQYVSQSQSLNLFFPAGSNLSYVNACHIQAWKQGLKSLYYTRTLAVKSGTVVSFDASKVCASCEG